MSIIEAIILGLIQGLTEFLPVSSSGHLELGQVILGIEGSENLTFAVAVHGATVLSTIVVFNKEIGKLISGTFTPKWNDEKNYLAKIFVSMIPVLLVALFLKDWVESFFTGNLVFVGSMLLITALLLGFSNYAPDRGKSIGYWHALVIGIAQAFAVLPGISRSGATISTGLILGNKRQEMAKFSFLMVLIPIIGANLLDLMEREAVPSVAAIGTVPLIVGFISAFVSGLLACKLMIAIVNRSKLIYFAIYCVLVGATAIIFGS